MTTPRSPSKAIVIGVAAGVVTLLVTTLIVRGSVEAARAIFAEGITSASFVLYGLFKTNRSVGAIFKSSSNWNGNYDFQFQSERNPLYRAWMDPKSPGRYYRSVVGNLNLTAATIRGS